MQIVYASIWAAGIYLKYKILGFTMEFKKK